MSTLNVASRMSPPTGSGAAVRVLAKVAMSEPRPVTCSVGWNFQVLLRYSSTTGPVNVTGAPTRIGLVRASHGSGVSRLPRRSGS